MCRTKNFFPYKPKGSFFCFLTPFLTPFFGVPFHGSWKRLGYSDLQMLNFEVRPKKSSKKCFFGPFLGQKWGSKSVCHVKIDVSFATHFTSGWLWIEKGFFR